DHDLRSSRTISVGPPGSMVQRRSEVFLSPYMAGRLASLAEDAGALPPLCFWAYSFIAAPFCGSAGPEVSEADTMAFLVTVPMYSPARAPSPALYVVRLNVPLSSVMPNAPLPSGVFGSN